MREKHNVGGADGFSLIELMIVIAIILTVSAIAVPSLMNTVADVRLRSSASTLQGQLQQLRMRSVRDNKPYKMKMTTQGEATMVYLDLDGGDDYDSEEPAVGLARDVTVASSGAPTMPSGTLNTSGWTAGTMSTNAWFNARGLPCDGSGGACNTTKGYIYYLSQTRTTSNTAWAAVSVTPAGRIKVWRWTGSAWQ
ncbi:MAG TPA: prepilin-type N-terminal cleavage/methylation domain-containing protein [Terriglobales bacterium]|nr:prepilin-type N-terminal cleavage/methylation domain-containing protein [Terriglobales bacterium]